VGLTCTYSAQSPIEGSDVENLIVANKSISELMELFGCGDIAIPEIRRDVVWDADQIKNLIDSIKRG